MKHQMTLLLLGMAIGFIISSIVYMVIGKDEKATSNSLVGILCGIIALVVQSL